MFGFIPSIGPWELGLILIIVLLIFGPGKLPDVGKFLGKGMREFKNAVNSDDKAQIDKPEEEIKDVKEEDIEKVDEDEDKK
ncbi:MAG: sec-independent protein translocase protein TatA [Clostridia bacterium]|jgi:sec-independent protein translocase protein TatA|nr:tatA [Clostridiales bacterium]MDK2985574.1 sec-independent protein translocase protein TatA [Clostridia bacterium]